MKLSTLLKKNRGWKPDRASHPVKFADCWRVGNDFFNVDTLKKIELPDLREFFKTHGWCQGFPARKADGHWCYSMDSEACSWCLAGACNHLSGSGYFVLRKLLDEAVGGSIVAWNDAPGRTLEQVLELLEKVYAAA